MPGGGTTKLTEHNFRVHDTIDVYTSQGVGRGLQSPDSGKTSIFVQKLNFSGRSQQPKSVKYIFLYLVNEKNGNHSV